MLGQFIKKQRCIFVDGDLQLDEAGLINASIYAVGNILLSRTTIVGWLYADGDIILSRDVLVEGEIYANRNISLRENATIKGNACARGIIKTNPKAKILLNAAEGYAGPWPSVPYSMVQVLC